MSIAEKPTQNTTMTIEEYLALPDDGVQRELIEGRLWEGGMTFRNRTHSRIEAHIAWILVTWIRNQPLPRGEVVSNEAGFRLSDEPGTLVGIDVAVVSASLVSGSDSASPYFEGPPLLAVEILSPTDEHREVVKKVNLYLKSGTVVWVVDPDFRTLSVHRTGSEAEMYNITQEVSGDPELAGLRMKVADVFAS